MVNKPQILEVVQRKASAMLGRPIRVVAIDKSKKKGSSRQLEELLSYGRAHPECISIKE